MKKLKTLAGVHTHGWF